jgi:hypothetical protein
MLAAWRAFSCSLSEAATQRPGAGLIHHSDRGVQYASAEYRKMMQAAGFRASMSRRADCYDNAPMESFFHTIKTELIHHQHYATREEAKRDVFLHRRLLQSEATSLGHRISQPGRDGAKSSLTLSIFSGEDQRSPRPWGLGGCWAGRSSEVIAR